LRVAVAVVQAVVAVVVLVAIARLFQANRRVVGQVPNPL